MIAICTEHVAVGSGVLQPPLSNASVKRQAINGDVCVCVCSVMHSNMHISRSYSFCLNHRSRDVIHVPPVCRQTSIRLILLFLSYHTPYFSSISLSTCISCIHFVAWTGCIFYLAITIHHSPPLSPLPITFRFRDFHSPSIPLSLFAASQSI